MGRDIPAKDQSTPDTNKVHQRTGQVAGEYHETESDGVGGVDEIRRSGSACTEGVHGGPDARAGETAETDYGNVEH